MAKRKPNTVYSGKLQFEFRCKYENHNADETPELQLTYSNASTVATRQEKSQQTFTTKANKFHNTADKIKTQKANEVEAQRIEFKGLKVPIL